MKTWLLNHRVLSVILSVCLLFSTVTVLVIKPWQLGPTVTETTAPSGSQGGQTQPSAKPAAPTPAIPGGTSGAAPTGTPTGAPTGPGGSGNTSGSGLTPISALTFTLRFESNGGTPIPERKLRGGSLLGGLPVPYKAGFIFMGWHYDAALKNRVSSKDTIRGNLTLYALYSDTAALQEAATPRFATRLDQPVDFSFIVTAPAGLSASQVAAAITAKNITSPSQKDFFTVSGSAGRFTVAARSGRFDAGATYKFTLADDRLAYEGYGASIRDFNFTTAKAEVLNLSLSESVIYIPVEDVSDMTLNGEGVTRLSVPLATTSLGSIDYKSGTFTYGKTALAVGSSVAIYRGVRPDQRSINDGSGDGEVAYVTVTAVNGTTYSFKNADAEEILFTPDVLPVSNEADQDGQPDNHAITVAKSTMDFSSAAYTAVGLDSETTVDVGDFIAFYAGSFGAPTGKASYGRIIAVRDVGETLVITYADASVDDVMAAMDIYDTEGVDGEKLLGDTPREQIELGIEKQALASGFADEAAKRLAALALETDSFTQMKGDFDLKGYNIVLDDGTPLTPEQLQLMEGKKVEAELSELKATLATKLVHFEGLEGVRCTLKVGVTIKISTGEESQIVINITGYFEQEARIAINTSGGAVWKWWGIFPYIDEYQLNANIDLYEYTGIRVDATITTKEKDSEFDWDTGDVGQNIGKQIKELLDAKDKYIGDGEETVADGLADRYAAMLENESDWVELFSQKIFEDEGSIDPFHILVYEMGLHFVVSANMNISIGCDFYYENAKRYNYSIGVFNKTCANETIDLVEEHYEFTFYVMGTMGIRAGLKFEIKVGVFSTKLASIGLSAEVGAYVRVWGYFYYQLSWTASAGTKTWYAGALLFELGIYLEIKFEAQVFDGTFSYNPTLYENEWPLWSAGSRENVQSFSELDDDPEIVLKKHLRTFRVPDEWFQMSYFDLKTGDVDAKIYDDATNFKIDISNSAFAYDAKTNLLTLTPDADLEEAGDMVITWISAPLAFTSEPIQRTVSLAWDNYNNGYAIMFNTNGGSAVPTIMQRFNSAITRPAAPVKAGYDFAGWFADDALTLPYTIPATMPASDAAVHAKWVPRSDTRYTVEHYLQNLNNGLYTLADTDSLQGTTDSAVRPAVKAYAGFSAPPVEALTIRPDGSAILKYYYGRNSYTLTFGQNIDNGESDWVYSLKFGAAITAPRPAAMGYDFTGWNSPVAETMPASNLVYTAQWLASKETPYRVEHYIQNTTDDAYTLQTAEYRAGESDTSLSLAALARSSAGINYQYGTVGGQKSVSTTITRDGKRVIRLYYLRQIYTLSTRVENGSDGSRLYRFGALIDEPEQPARAGYTFSGWFLDAGLSQPAFFGQARMPADHTTLFGRLAPDTDTPYRVEHYVEGTDGQYALQKTESLAGTTDTAVTLADCADASLLVTGGLAYLEGKADGATATATTIAGDGSRIIQLYYRRSTHTLTFQVKNGTDSSTRVRYGALIAEPSRPARSGYTFSGWYHDAALTQPVSFGQALMPAGDTTLYGRLAPDTDTPYRVEHYVEGIDSLYTLQKTESRTGTTDTAITLAGCVDASLLVAGGIAYLEGKADGVTTTATTIAGDGTRVIRLYYQRLSHELVFRLQNGASDRTAMVKYGDRIQAPEPAPQRTGYDLAGWDPAVPATMPATSLTCTALWTPRTDTAYTVRHIRQALDGTWPASGALVALESRTGTTAATTGATATTYEGFTVEPITQANIAADGSTVVDVRYRRNRYPLTWLANGSTFRSESVLFGQTITAPEAQPQKAGYVFQAWAGYEEGATMPAEAVTCTAQWLPASNTAYTIHHRRADLAGSFTILETETRYGTTATETTAAARSYTGFTADGFSQAIIAADGSTVIDIHYERNRYAVTWLADGVPFRSETLPFGAPLTAPASQPVRTGYDFAGWAAVPSAELLDPSAVMPAHECTFTAVWTAHVHAVTFAHENGTGDSDTVFETFGSPYILPPAVPNLAGYAFNGWYTAETGGTLVEGGTLMLSDAPHILHAQWVVGTNTQYTVRHFQQNILDDGYTLAEAFTQTLTGVTEALTSAAPRNDPGFTALPFTQAAIQGDGSTTVDILYSRNAYALTFRPANGSAGLVSQLRYGAAVALPPAPEKSGYIFTGWFLDSAPETPYTSGTMPAGPLTLTAGWIAKTATVRFLVNDGNPIAETTRLVTYDSLYGSLPTPTRTGYAFAGWFTAASGGTQVLADTTVAITSDQNLYAHWTASSSTVQFDVNGGDLMAETSRNVTYDSTYGTLPAPTRTGYAFAGWFTAASGGSRILATDTVKIVTTQTLYAHWTANTYSVAFQAASATGGTMADQTLTYNTAANLTPNAYTRTGYSFAGWAVSATGPVVYANSAQVLNLTDVSLGTITLYAQWTADLYSISFQSNGGSAIASLTGLQYGDTLAAPAAPTRSGYAFAGWFTSTSLTGSPYLFGTMPAGSFTLYAKWSLVSYGIQYGLNGGSNSGANPASYTVESAAITLAAPTRSGYTFAGWYDNAGFSGSPISGVAIASGSTGDRQFHARWTPVSYPIQYASLNGASHANPGSYTIETAVTLTDPSSRTGYTFAGWYDNASYSGTPVTGIALGSSGARTFYARWSAIAYSIGYQLNGGSNSGANPASYTLESAAITLAAPTRTSYTFAGWYDNAGFSGSPIASVAIASGSTGDRMFYARWTPVSYPIQYASLNGASHANPGSYTVETAVTLTDPNSRTGYTFAGWYDNASFSGTPVTGIALGSSGTRTFYARWSAIAYSIGYQLNGGTDSSGNPASYTVESAAITLAEPTRTGYTFAGWFNDSGFTSPVSGVAIASGSTGDRMFYAGWTPVTYTIQYQLNSGSNSGLNPSSYTIETSTITLAEPTRSGYTFAGWYDNSSFSGSAITSLPKGSTGNRTYWARWTINSYSITYSLNGGTNSGANPASYTVESSTITLQNPTRGADDYFAGWFASSDFSNSTVTHITQGSTGDVFLYAKWLNFGSFTVSGSGSTFTITRSGGSNGTQTVSYRTQNGSAIGGTHFTHVDASVTFGEGETSKTVTVTESTVTAQYAGLAATAFANADRTYALDIYQVTGGGKLGATTRATRTMTKDSAYTIDAGYLNNYRTIASVSGQSWQVWENPGSGYGGTVYSGLSGPVLSNAAFASANLRTYIQQTASAMKVQLQGFTGRDDGWRMWRFVLFNNHASGATFSSDKTSATIPNLPTGTKAALVYGITADQNNTDTYSVTLPGNVGALAASGTGYAVSISDEKRASGQDGGSYVLYGFGETAGISIGAFNPAGANSSWWFNAASLAACPKDTTEPTLKGVAPMASSTYNIGDKAVVSLVFDEIVSSATSVTINTMLSSSAFTLTGGLGTNVLSFEGTVTNNGALAPTLGDIVLNNAGNIKDMVN